MDWDGLGYVMIITCLNFELSWIWGSLENRSESTSLMHKYIVISFIYEVLLPDNKEEMFTIWQNRLKRTVKFNRKFLTNVEF